MKKRSVDPRTPKEQEQSLREFASKAGVSLEELCRIEEGLRKIPIERFLEGCFGKDHGAFYDPHADLWIVPDKRYRGCGFAFTAIRSDRSSFSGVVP
ncbi:MAG: helix-turn-helix transcriptional regulator, partial [Alphaproteobacteria bacterium]|nr:helix-turn-helix transcriptional regulator [Alphaproteobacteria bacterium]